MSVIYEPTLNVRHSVTRRDEKGGLSSRRRGFTQELLFKLSTVQPENDLSYFLVPVDDL